jgi:hypothetical protein
MEACQIQARWAIPLFYALQFGDVITTLLFVSRGIAETNPLASYLMEHFGPLVGLLILKAAAISIALCCRVTAHPRFMRGINAFYGIIVVVNILTICTVKP